MNMLDWKNVPIPLGVVIVIFAGWFYVSGEFVHAEDYKQAQQQNAIQFTKIRIDQKKIARNALQSELFNLRYRLREVADPHPDDLKRVEQLEQDIADLDAEIEALRNE